MCFPDIMLHINRCAAICHNGHVSSSSTYSQVFGFLNPDHTNRASSPSQSPQTLAHLLATNNAILSVHHTSLKSSHLFADGVPG